MKKFEKVLVVVAFVLVVVFCSGCSGKKDVSAKTGESSRTKHVFVVDGKIVERNLEAVGFYSWKNENGTLEIHSLKTAWFSFDRNDGASEAYLTGFVMSESAAMACFSDEE